jgi:putative serine protease PepD
LNNYLDNWPHENVYSGGRGGGGSHYDNDLSFNDNPNDTSDEDKLQPKIYSTKLKNVKTSSKIKNHSTLSFRAVGGLMLLGLFAGVVGGLSVNYSINEPNIEHSVILQTADNPILPGSITEIAKLIQPGVVHINGSNPSEYSSGSGFIISETGYVITNHHVIQSSLANGTVQVVLENGEELVGEIIGSSKGYDIAVIKLPGDKSYQTIAVGDSKQLQVGELVIAAGSPLGLQGTVTQGIVSATSRPVVAGGGDNLSFVNAIQTDAAINPGNSGGPLVNSAGAVVGVNSAIITTSQDAGSIGLGFAIPMNTVMRIFEEIVKTGKSQAPVLGVNLELNYQGEGVKVENVAPGGPAEQSGVKPNDIITKIDEAIVKNSTDLIVKVRDKVPGEYAKLEIIRNGENLEITVQTQGKDE